VLLKQFYKKRDDGVDENASLQDVVDKMHKNSLRYMVVLSPKGFPLGILTERDILFLYNANIDFKKTNAFSKSTKALVKAHLDRELEYALNFMVDHNIRRVVVIDERDKFLGVVEQEEIIFEFESKSTRCDFKIFEMLLNESQAMGVDKSTSLKTTLELMKEKNFGSILVTHNKESIGILTETDILELAKNNIDKHKSVEHFMHSPIHKVSIKSSMQDCITLMRSKKIRRIIVEEIDEFGVKIDYIVTSKDILNNLQGNYSKFLETKLKSQRTTFENMEDLVIEAYDFGDSQVISWANKSAKEKLHVNIDDSILTVLPSKIVKEFLEAFKLGNNYYKERVEIADRLYRISASSVSMFGTSVIKILLSDFTELYLVNRELNEQVSVMSDSMSEQESMQNEILNQHSIGIGYISMSGEILFANDYVLDLLGYTQDELLGKNVLDITYEDDKELTLVNKKQSSDSEMNVEKRYIHKDGHSIWVYISLSISKGKDGKPQYIIGFIKDIRERKESEKRLKLAQEVFDNTNEGILIADKKLRVQAANGAFCNISGYTREEIISSSVFFMRSSNNDEYFYKKMWLSIKKDGYWNGEMWSVRKNGERFPQWLNISTIKDDNDEVINYIGVFSDISTIKQSEADLEFLAHHDPLTKLPNRLLLTSRLSQAMKRAKRENSKIAVLFLDLDRFKEINDTFGHSYGDEILTTVTTRFKIAMREKDTIARIGGDEFIILIEEMEHVSDVDQVLIKILDIFKDEIVVYQHSFKLSASIGVSIYPDDGLLIEDLIKNADAAMYQAKDAGRNTYRFYTQEMTEKLFSKMTMKAEIDKGLKNEEFILHYQPQISLQSGKVLGAEALVRWNHTKKGLVYPDKFIEVAESTKQIVDLGKQVLEMACTNAKKWIDSGIFSGKISVNISAVQIKQNDFYDVIISTLKKTGLSGSFLELELTESYMMENPKDSIVLFKKLKNHGITLSIDDFGTGYSSLSYLKKLPVDKLKIDRSFIMDIPNEKEDMAITSTIIAMAKSLGLGVIAEGIETKYQHNFLKDQGCYEAQGFLYSKPIDLEKFEKYLEGIK
jgi:diguanylate cyclase (GGDEF)-like protein/PAS domain S-box-containing protein